VTAVKPAAYRPGVPLPLRAVNAVVCTLERLGLPLTTLDEQALCAAACRKTGLSDFGDDRFRVGIRRHAQGSDDVDRLQGLIRFLARRMVFRTLCNRLLIEQQIKEHPEILQVTVPRPLIVAGMGRTGTTLLQNLLAQDPASRPLLIWEAAAPAIPRSIQAPGRDPRIRRAKVLVWLLKHGYPQLAALHTFEANGPQECGPLFWKTFLLPLFGKNFRQWLGGLSADADRVEWAYREYYRMLQLLEWQRPAAGHWLLKWPLHLLALETLLKTLPGAVVVQTHRDPGQIIASFCQLIAHLAFFYSDERWQTLPPDLVAITVELLGRAAEARPRIPSGRLLDVHYRELTADPIGVLRRIYDHFGYRYTDEFERRARQWLQEHPRRERVANYYDLEQFGLDRASVERAFAPYRQQYGIEPEA
jgi:hypothetical protein